MDGKKGRKQQIGTVRVEVSQVEIPVPILAPSLKGGYPVPLKGAVWGLAKESLWFSVPP